MNHSIEKITKELLGYLEGVELMDRYERINIAKKVCFRLEDLIKAVTGHEQKRQLLQACKTKCIKIKIGSTNDVEAFSTIRTNIAVLQDSLK